MKDIKITRKAQMKMGETISVLIVFFFLLFLGIIFYSNIERRDIQKKANEIEESASVDIAQTIQFLPELKCTSEDATRALCIDSLKLSAFANISSGKKAFYQSVFGNTKIEITEIYPNYSFNSSAPIGQDSGYFLVYEGPKSDEYFTTFIPVSLFVPYPYPGRYKVSLLKITSYTFS